MTSETLALSCAMPRPVVVLIILFAAGAGAAWWLSQSEVPVVNPLPEVLRRVQREVDAADQKVNGATVTREEPPTDSGEPDESSPDFGGIAVELVRVRELQSLPLTQVEMPRAEVLQHITRWLERQLPGDYGQREGRALAALGAIPEPVDTVALRAAFWSHQIGAWLDTGDDTLALVEQAEGDGAKENALGLAFAQLFREFGSDLFQTDGKSLNSDAWLARLGLIAGDASFTRLRHALAHPSRGGGGGVGDDPDDPSREIPLPVYLRERDLAAFGVGLDFVSSLHGLGKFEQVNAAYGRPPVASIELLEPSHYLADKQFNAESIAWSDVMTGGVAPFWDDTLGAICLVLLLKQYLPQPVAADVVPGWRGDRLLVYPSKGQPGDHVVWQSFWKDSNAADAFFGAMRQSLLKRHKNARADSKAPGGVFKLDGPDRYVVLTRTHNGRGVFFVDAADASFADVAWKKFTTRL